MRDIPRFAAILMLVAALAAGSLAWVNEITKPLINEQEKGELEIAKHEVLPNAKTFNEVKSEGEILLYQGFSDNGKLIGYVFQAEGDGYAGTIKTIVGIDTLFIIQAIKILSQQETPGLGTQCEEIRSGEETPWWCRQFSGKNAKNIQVIKDGGQIEAITGATITSRAITNAIAEKAVLLQNFLKQ